MQSVQGAKLLVAVSICFFFGSIHAYSVLLAPLQAWLDIDRTAASFGYSAAVLALTAGVFLNGQLFQAVPASQRLLASGGVAAAGLGLAMGFPGVLSLVIGFGVMHGLANGLAYGLSMSLAAQAMPGREATAMGLATAAYGLGAVLFAQLYAVLLLQLGVARLFLALAILLLLICFAGALIIRRAPLPVPSAASACKARIRGIWKLWSCYFLGAFSGIMILGHAPWVARDLAGSGSHAGLAAGAVSLGSVAGAYLGGILAERLSARASLSMALAVQALVMCALLFLETAALVLVALLLSGLCYGALIAAVPAAVRRLWGGRSFESAYGKIFTAWGAAGLIGPLVAGLIYDITSHYTLALVLAACASLLSVLLTRGEIE